MHITICLKDKAGHILYFCYCDQIPGGKNKIKNTSIHLSVLPQPIYGTPQAH